MTAGGYWLCAVKRRETSRRTYQKRREVKLARQREHHHAHGWLTKRRRDLDRQRTRILEQLAQLDQEAKAC